MNNSSTSYDDNVTGDTSRLVYLIISIVIFSTALVVNASFLVVGVPSLKKTFHNILVLLLSFKDSLVSLSVTVFAILKLTQDDNDSTTLCLVFIMIVCYGFITEYLIIFLLGFVRFVNVTRQYNSIHKLELYKYPIILIAHLASLLLVVIVKVSVREAAAIPSCTALALFGKRYRTFILVEWIPTSLLMLVVILMYIKCTYDLWKMFFKKKAVKPTPHSKRMELTPKQHLKSNKVAPCSIEEITEDETTDAGMNSNRGATPTCLDAKFKPPRQPKISTVEPPLIEMRDVGVSADEHNQDEPEKLVRKRERIVQTTKGKATSKTVDIWEIRAIKTNLLVISTTIFFTGPFAMTFLYDLFAQDFISEETRLVVYLFCGVSHILDPFIYAFRVPEIRKEIKTRFSRQ